MAPSPVVRQHKPSNAFPNPTPRTLLVALQAKYSTRLHMFLIVAASVSVAVLTTRFMLHHGVHAMWIRYAFALLLAYGTFFVGVWVWLHLSPYGCHLRAQWRKEDLSLPDINGLPNVNISGGSTHPVEAPFQGGGGGFDGGGAAGSWDVPNASVSVDMPSTNLLDGVGDVGIDDEGGIFVVIAGILLAIVLAAVFGATAYVIYQAPAILAEVIFEVLLGSPLARGAKALDTAHWASALLKKTWVPFGVMAVAAMSFAFFCNALFPQAATAGQVMQLLMH